MKKMTDEELLRLANVGIVALVDEATGYQKRRKPRELKEIYNKNTYDRKEE